MLVVSVQFNFEAGRGILSSLGDRPDASGQLRRFSGSTRETYLREVERLSQPLHQPLDSIAQDQLQDYILFWLTER